MTEPRGLIGRQQELELATSILASGRSLVLGGHAGGGKTRLAQELTDRWPGPTEWISGAAGTSAIPFGAVVRLLTDVSSDPSTQGAASSKSSAVRSSRHARSS